MQEANQQQVIAPNRVLLETVAALKRGYRLIAHQGGTYCFAPETLVITANGSKPISEIKKGDLVKSFNENDGLIEFKDVKDVFRYANEKRTVKIMLKSGKSITCTEDHRFFYKQKWVPISEILKQFDERDSRI